MLVAFGDSQVSVSPHPSDKNTGKRTNGSPGGRRGAAEDGDRDKGVALWHRGGDRARCHLGGCEPRDLRAGPSPAGPSRARIC